jgi:alpha-N-arabinofuranosidase
LIQAQDGNWFLLSLGFRQIHEWQPYHHLGREVFLTPVQFGNDGWFTAGQDGTTEFQHEITGDFLQERKNLYTFENTDWKIDWCYMRKLRPENYELSDNQAVLHGCELTLEDVDSPTFLALRQLDFNMELTCDVQFSEEKPVDENSKSDSFPRATAGITVFMCEDEHYDLALRRNASNPDAGMEAVLRLNLGDIKHEQTIVPIASDTCRLIIRSNSITYHFFVQTDKGEISLGQARSKYLSSEVSSGFTGVVLGFFAEGNGIGRFTNFRCEYME